jgi:hypothetical protein
MELSMVQVGAGADFNSKEGTALNASALIRFLPRPIDSALRVWCYPPVLLARNLSIRLTRMQGITRTGQATVLVAGPDPWAYDLPLRFFKNPPQQTIIGTVPLWRLRSTLEKMAPDVDLVLARVDKLAARLFPSTYLRIPEWVNTGRAVPEDPAALLRCSESLTRDMRVVRQNGLETNISTCLEDFEEFYHSMYVPFIGARHGSMAWFGNDGLLRDCFRRGGIIWLTRGGQRVAGLVFEFIDQALGTRAYATRDGYVGVTKKGAGTALYLHAIRHAVNNGCKFLDLGGCHACLTDGVLLYKRKWGVRVQVRPANQFYALVGWATWNSAVAAFLADVPLLHQSGGRLMAITAAEVAQLPTQADADKIYRTLHMPGVDRLVIVNTAGWPGDVVPPPSTVLIGGSPLPVQLVAG